MYNKLEKSITMFPPSPFNPLLLRQMRLRANLSMETVALLAGLHDKAQVSRFERGLVIPLATTLGKLLQTLQPEPTHLDALFNLVRQKPE